MNQAGSRGKGAQVHVTSRPALIRAVTRIRAVNGQHNCHCPNAGIVQCATLAAGPGLGACENLVGPVKN